MMENSTKGARDADCHPRIKDVFAIAEILKRSKIHRQSLKECDVTLKELKDNAIIIIEEFKVDINKNRGLSIEDFSSDKVSNPSNTTKQDDKTKNDDETGQKRTIDLASDKRLIVEKLNGKDTSKTLLQYVVDGYSNTDGEEKDCLKEVITSIIKNCPSLILSPKQDDTPKSTLDGQGGVHPKEKSYQRGPISSEKRGVAPILSLMLMQDIELVRLMLKRLEVEHKTEGKVHDELCRVDFSACTGRTLRAGSVYHVAALTHNTAMYKEFKEVCGNACIISKAKKNEDNVLHALVRYGKRTKSVIELEKVIATLDHLQTEYRSEIQHLWKGKNKKSLTPLQLAAKKGQHRIFSHIMSIELLYVFKDGDEDCYDVTDIDTIPLTNYTKQSGRNKSKPNESKIQRNEEFITENGAISTTNGSKSADKDEHKRHISVLHLIRSHVPHENGLQIVHMPAVRAVIDKKWKTYRCYIWLWLAIHFVIMSLCVWYAILRADLDNPFIQEDSEKKKTALGLGIIVLVYGVTCIVMQVMRNINKLRRDRYCKFNKRHISSSFLFAWWFGIFGLLIVLDFGLACSISEYGNFLLPYILIVGWSLTLYFLQVIEHFSVFVVLIQRLTPITIQFALVTLLFLVGFSGAAYIAMHDVDLRDGNNMEVDTFKHFGKTLFKMLTIMIGLGDLEPVFDADYLIMTISIFVLFALLTTILLLNALLAYMSEICTLVVDYQTTKSVSSKAYARLQKVSLIVQLEDLLPECRMVPGETKGTFFSDSTRKYITLRSPKEPEADLPAQKGDKEPRKPPISSNKVSPMKTLEITEITQGIDAHNNPWYFVKNLNNANDLK